MEKVDLVRTLVCFLSCGTLLFFQKQYPNSQWGNDYRCKFCNTDPIDTFEKAQKMYGEIYSWLTSAFTYLEQIAPLFTDEKEKQEAIRYQKLMKKNKASEYSEGLKYFLGIGGLDKCEDVLKEAKKQDDSAANPGKMEE